MSSGEDSMRTITGPSAECSRAHAPGNRPVVTCTRGACPERSEGTRGEAPPPTCADAFASGTHARAHYAPARSTNAASRSVHAPCLRPGTAPYAHDSAAHACQTDAISVSTRTISHSTGSAGVCTDPLFPFLLSLAKDLQTKAKWRLAEITSTNLHRLRPSSTTCFNAPTRDRTWDALIKSQSTNPTRAGQRGNKRT